MEPLRVNTPAQATSVKWPTERRQRHRNKIFTPAYASFHGANALDLHEVLDLHEEGFCAQAPATLDLNQNVGLRLVLSEAAAPIAAEGRIVWATRGRLGVQFDQLPEERLTQLRRWLFLNAMNAAADEDADSLAALGVTEEPALLADRSLLLGALDAVRREVQLLAGNPDASLRLLADRSLAFTGASGAAVAVLEGESMVCRASSGHNAPPLGTSFQTGVGFSGECVRRQAMLRCDDAETDSHVDAENCRELGIRSILAVPLFSRDSVVGVIELFSSVAHAFHEREEEIMSRMAEFAAAVIGKEKVDSASLVAASFPFADSLNQDTHNIPLRRSHILLLIAAAALIALVLGYTLAPWLERLFTPPPKPVVHRPVESQPLQAAASNPVPSVPHTMRAVAHTTTIGEMRQLAESGDAAAQFSMGTHYAIGDGVQLDSAEAARWFTKAAEQGHVIAQDAMGAYYEAGRGVPRDLHKAYFWSLLGRAGKNETSKYRVNTLSASLSREEMESARQEAEQWIHQHTPAAKPSLPTP